MSTINSNLLIGKKDNAFFIANPTLVLLDGQLIYNEDTAELFIGDGVTQLSALTAINGGSYTFQNGLTESGGNVGLGGTLIQETYIDGNVELSIGAGDPLRRFFVSAYRDDTGVQIDKEISPLNGYDKTHISDGNDTNETRTYADRTEFDQPIQINSEGVSSVVVTDANRQLKTVSLGANQSIRRNSANTAYEAFTPNKQLFTIHCVHAPVNATFTSGANLYWSNILNTAAAAPRTNAGQQLITVPFNCKLIAATATAWTATGGVTQANSSLFFRLNGNDNVLTNSFQWSSSAATARNFNITGLNVDVVPSDSFEIKLTVGTLVTPPSSSSVVSVFLYFERD